MDLLMEYNPLTEKMIEIQAIVNSRQSILNEKYNWDLIMTCGNIISATESALETYLTDLSNSAPIEMGKRLLNAYGVLQSLYVQQNTVKTLCNTFGIEYPKNLDLEEIRQIRHDMGHPTERNHGKYGEVYSAINSVSPCGNIIYIVTDYPQLIKESNEREKNRKTVAVMRFMPVNLPDLIDKQRRYIIEVLDNVLHFFQKKEKQCPVREEDLEHAKYIVVREG